MKDHGPVKVPHDQQCDAALEHYEALATECHHWSSIVPKAIEFYKRYGEAKGSLSDRMEALYEKLAAIEHERWSDWQKWVHSIGIQMNNGLLIPQGMVDQWQRQIETPYEKLSEKEKDSDRKQVDRYWPLVEVTGFTSDGYHTFDELYEHRIVLFIKLCETMKAWHKPYPVWRSKLHSDGSSFDGWFIMGIFKESGKQITYHLPMDKWRMCGYFAETLDKAPEFDGHTHVDVLKRMDFELP